MNQACAISMSNHRNVNNVCTWTSGVMVSGSFPKMPMYVFQNAKIATGTTSAK